MGAGVLRSAGAMKKRRIVGITLGVAVLAAVGLGAFLQRDFQRAIIGWRPVLAGPPLASAAQRVLVDGAHHNASQPGFGQRFQPFATLLEADGFAVERLERPLDAAALAGVSVFVTANPSGAAKPQMFGLNLPGGDGGDRGAPAFTRAEIDALVVWVEAGGSLLLVADHAPFGAAARELAEALGVTMGCGFVEVPDELSDPLEFSRANERLGEHAILPREGAERVQRVQTFTGQSLRGPADAVALLRLPANAIEYVPPPREQDGPVEIREQPSGPAQGLAFERGRGRVVVLGEAAMLTAQTFRGQPFGMDPAVNDNQQFALNTLHWLARLR